MSRLVFLFMALFWSGSLWAVPVQVRTGEHAEFTRVVLTIPVGTDWRLGRDDVGYVLRLGVADGYDTSQFFDLIPRDRITAISQDVDAGELRMGVACSCSADAFLYRPDILVIDIRDGAPAEDATFELALDEPVRAVALPAQPADQEDYAVPRNSLLPLVFSQASKTPELIRRSDTVAEVTEAEPDDAPAANLSTLDDGLNALEKSVTESLARALSQGLLETELVPDGDQGAAEDALRQALGLDGVLAPGLRATTSVDRDAVPEDPLVPVTQGGDMCVPGVYFDVASWGDDRPYSVQVSEARARLTTEFDRTEEAAITDLARRLVYFGFGREAVQVLALDDTKSQERRYLVAIARIIDGEPIEAGLFDQQVSCASDVALWAMLAPTDAGLDAQIDRPSVLRAFKSLPFGLQSHLGPQLAERFISIGDSDGASQALATVRGVPDPPFEAAIAETSLTQALGDDAAAIAQLADLASTDARMTPEALTELFVEAVENDVSIDQKDFALADALRFEGGRRSAVADLAVAQVRAYLHFERFVSAAALIASEADAMGLDRHRLLMDEYADAAVNGMDDVAFLGFAFDQASGNLNAESENALARRLLDLGFPDRAGDLVMARADGDAELIRPYLRAEVALAIADPDAAMTALDGLDTDKAEALRQIAMDVQTVDVIVADTLLAADPVESLWRRGDWDDLTQQEDPLLRAASVAVLEPELALLDPQTPLASSRALLDRSAQSRAVLSDLLNRFAAPEDF